MYCKTLTFLFLFTTVSARYLTKSAQNFQNDFLSPKLDQEEELLQEDEAVFFAGHSFIGKRDTSQQQFAEKVSRGVSYDVVQKDLVNYENSEELSRNEAVYFAGHSFIG